jgi:hypothetical protein
MHLTWNDVATVQVTAFVSFGDQRFFTSVNGVSMADRLVLILIGAGGGR